MLIVFNLKPETREKRERILIFTRDKISTISKVDSKFGVRTFKLNLFIFLSSFTEQKYFFLVLQIT